MDLYRQLCCSSIEPSLASSIAKILKIISTVFCLVTAPPAPLLTPSQTLSVSSTSHLVSSSKFKLHEDIYNYYSLCGA